MPYLKDSPIMPNAGCAEPYVKVCESNPEKADPRPKHMSPIQTTHAGVAPRIGRGPGNFIEEAADQVAKRMAAKQVSA
jgi:hypothetical protein